MTRPLPGPPSARFDHTKLQTKRTGPSLTTKRPVGKMHFRNRSTGPKGLHPVQPKVTRNQSRQVANQTTTMNVKAQLKKIEDAKKAHALTKSTPIAPPVKMRNQHALRPYVKRLAHAIQSHVVGQKDSSGPWTLVDIASAYNCPNGTATGSGAIAIIELGGGYTDEDNAAFFKANDLPLPTITNVSVDGTENNPGTSDADVEVALDIQVSCGFFSYCTGKPASARIYWSQDITLALQKILADVQSGIKITDVTISWGADEADWGAPACQACDVAVSALRTAGVRVWAAAGDNDSSDGGTTPANVDCPASCPNVIGCGGTSKPHTGEEVVWNNSPENDADGEGTGGGYSTVFPLPAWQNEFVPTPPNGLGRMVPDVSANADPNTGYMIEQGGQTQVVGGTSAVAPLYAGLFTAIGASPSNITVPESASFYQNQVDFNDITQGGNGTYEAQTGPDACTGVGTPNGSKLLAVFGAADPAPTPSPTPNPTPTPTPGPTPSSSPTLAQVEAAITATFAKGFPLISEKIATERAIAAVAALPGWSS
jgi:kumamolisin